MTKQQAILTDWINCLKNIKTTNAYAIGKNYSTNIGNYIKDFDPKIIEEGKNALIVEDKISQFEDQPEIAAAHYWDLEIVHKIIWPNADSSIPDIRNIEMDIIHCIGSNEESFLNKYRDTIFHGIEGEKNAYKGIKQVGELKLTLKIRFGTERFLIGEPDYIAGF